MPAVSRETFGASAPRSPLTYRRSAAKGVPAAWRSAAKGVSALGLLAAIGADVAVWHLGWCARRGGGGSIPPTTRKWGRGAAVFYIISVLEEFAQVHRHSPGKAVHVPLGMGELL